MERLLEIYNSATWAEAMLIFAIILFIGIAGWLFFFIIVIRSEKIERRKKHDQYSPIIDTIFMSVVFAERNYASIKEDPEYTDYLKKKNFRKQMMKSIINLHQNYGGTSARVLEAFYYESGLMKTSLCKLKSNEWQVVCMGIQELAEMKVSKAFPALVKLINSRNKEIKITAIKACTALNVNKGIVHLTQHKDPIDMWEQVNIINAFKRNYAEENEDVEILLTSGNMTVVSLGLKIIHTLELARKIPYVADLVVHAPNDAIKLEAQDLLHFLTTKTKNDDWF